MELGDCYRNIDRTRLEFFALEAEIDLLSSNEVRNTQAVEKAAAPVAESFALMLKRGLAQALTVGMVLAVAVLAAALIIYLSWR